MTVLVGVKCKDGIVIGADSMATSAMGPHSLMQTTSNDKIVTVGERMLLASTGAVGLGQRLQGVVQELWDNKKLQGNCLECSALISRGALENFASTRVPMRQHDGLGFGALLGIVANGEAHLVEFGVTDFQPEIKEKKISYVAMGSGQMLAEPFLAFVNRVLWKEEVPDVELAKMGVFWVLDHTIKLAPGGVGAPIMLATIKGGGTKWKASVTRETQEQAQYISELENSISAQEPVAAAQPTPPPKPPTS